MLLDSLTSQSRREMLKGSIVGGTFVSCELILAKLKIKYAVNGQTNAGLPVSLVLIQPHAA